jgi:hypothetical protein
MNYYSTMLEALLSPPQDKDLSQAVARYHGDIGNCVSAGIRQLSTVALFKIMVYGQLTGCYSVRDLKQVTCVNEASLRRVDLEPIKRSTRCNALEKRDHHIYESIFYSLVDTACALGDKRQKPFKSPLRIIDASLIPLCLSSFNCGYIDYNSLYDIALAGSIFVIRRKRGACFKEVRARVWQRSGLIRCGH